MIDEAERQLDAFDVKWGEAYPSIIQSWRRNWTRIIPFFDYPPEIRKVIYTTHAIERCGDLALCVGEHEPEKNQQESWLVSERRCGSKTVLPGAGNISKKWTMPIRDWKAALNRFTIQFVDRMPSITQNPVYTKFGAPTRTWPL